MTYPMSDRKRLLPQFLEGLLDPQAYERWLKRKANSHFKRDRKRNYHDITAAAYRDAIHEAVLQCEGRDFYTGEELDWSLVSQYDNHESESGRHAYKAAFALLPTVDHFDSSLPNSGFRICAWRTNDSKHDLSYQGYIDLCIKVLKNAGYSVSKCT
jgi:hypothetical protein